MMKSSEIENKRAELLAEAENLHKRSNELTADEETRLEDCLTQIEALDKDLVHVRRSEKIEDYKAKMDEPVRQAPIVSVRSNRQSCTSAEALQLWLASHTQVADNSRDAHYRAAEHGFQLGQSQVRVPCDYNFRAQIYKGGSGTGAELIPTTYSSLVTEYLSFYSPLVGLVGSETTVDGNARVYFKLDDTSMESAYITASGGSEVTPTIPDTSLATDSVTISTFDITSGYQKVSWQAMRDSAVALESKIANANSHAHARKLEREILTATGNGSTGVQGIIEAASAMDDISAWTIEDIEGMVWQIPEQYRKGAIWCANSATHKNLYQVLKDDNQRTLFDKSVDQPFEYNSLGGYRFYISSFMPDDTLLFFQPRFYMLRMVEGQLFQVLKEKYAPHLAFLGLMSFGGAWLGPDEGAWTLALSA